MLKIADHTPIAHRSTVALDPERFLARLDGLAARAMENWAIPGMALAVCIRGQEPVLRTYGTRDTLTRAPVSSDTQFHTCSLTKSLTAAGLLLLLHEKQIELTTKVRDILPEFRLSDSYATEHVSLRDLLCHASGLPRHDKIWTPGDLSESQMMERLRHLALSSALRERFQYNNLGYVVLAAVVERLSGSDWEAYTRATLVEPLGFRAFSFSPAALESANDHAQAHPRQGASVWRGRNWPAPAPAGGLNASIRDMARWVEFLLGEELPGVSKDCTGKVLEQMMTPWMYSGTSTHSEIGACHYGLGLSCERYRRLRVVTHGGSMPGWGALLSLLPDEGVGIVVLTNRDPTPVPNMLAFALFDDVCDLAPVDWYTRFADLRTKFLAKEAEERKASAAAPSREATRELVEYEGSYDEPAYGRLRVLLEGTRLVWSWRGLSGHLRARHNDQFVLEEVKPERHQEPLVATFLHDGSGGINRLFIALEPEVPEIVFRRAS